MAGKIKGITIEIGGDTVPLQKALQGVNKEASASTKELRQIDKALKFDTNNVTLLTQKQEVLAKQVATTKEKLEILRQAQSQVEAQFQKGEIGADRYRAFQREVETTKTVLTGYENKLEAVNKTLSSHGQGVEINKSKLQALEKEQAQLASESEKLNSSFKLQESQLGSTASESDKLTLAQKKIASQSNLVEKQIANLEKQLELTKSEYGENSVEANKLEKTLNETKVAYHNLQNEMEELGQSSSIAKDGLSETNQLLKADLLMDFSDKLGELSQQLIEFGQNALDAFRQVDEGMDIIVTKTGATGDALDEMSEIAQRVAVNIAGAGFEEAGNAVGEVNTQFGLMGDALQVTAEDLLMFSQINGSDVTTSTIQSKQALEAYGLSVDWLSDVLDSVTYVAQGTGVSVNDLMNKAISGAPQIKALGLAFDEGVTLIGQFEKAGVDSSAALSSLSKATVAYAKDGKTLEEGLKGTIEAIQNSTNETESLTLASEIFGSKAASRMVDAIKRGAFSFDELSKTAENAAGIVATTFEATLDPIDQFEAAEEEMTLAMSEFGGVIAETFAPLLMVVVDIVKELVNWFSGLASPIKQAIVLFGGILTVIGLLLPFFLGLQAAALAMGTTIGGMLFAFAPIVGTVLAIAAGIAILIAGIKYLWEINEGFREVVLGIWETISSFITSVIQALSDFIMSIWGQLVSWWTENQELILAACEVVWNTIQSVIQTIMEILGPYLEASWNNIVLIVTTVWEVIKTVVETVITVILGIIKAIMQVITGDWKGAWETIKSVISTVWSAIQSIISTILSAIGQYIANTWQGIVGIISTLLQAIQSVVASIWQGISSTIGNILSGISSTVSGIWNGIKSSISNAINGAKDAVSSAINAIKNLFNFQFKWPHIPLPHFSISGSVNPLDWLKGGLPKIGVEWYAKGGILTKPTAFGINGNQLMIGGEAGKEAVLPLNRQTLGDIGRGIASTLDNVGVNITVNISDVIVREEADIDKLSEIVASRMVDELRRQKGLKGEV
ncbi:TPA: phage tail tape measure protein [Streptococcus suis]